MKMIDIPETERPREKAYRYGIETLSDTELLAIIINSGPKGYNALDIADNILDMSKGLYNLSRLNQKDLMSIKGIDKVKCVQLLSLITIVNRIKSKKLDIEERLVDIDYINEKYSYRLNSLKQEVMILLILNRNKKLLFETTLYKGSGSVIAVSVNDIIKNVILHDGYYFYIVHNHPNGNIRPSPQDILLTIRLMMRLNR